VNSRSSIPGDFSDLDLPDNLESPMFESQYWFVWVTRR
jgi:hypothetical protein